MTSRERSRWVLPKGKIKRGFPAHRSAALEAFEEAGVIGTISAVPVGTYKQVKTGDDGVAQTVAVRAYPMLVIQETMRWPEMRLRKRRWMPIAVSIDAVKNGELRAVLLDFAKALPELSY